MIEVSELQVNREGKTICAVEQFSLRPGDRVAVIGSNGSGKTTLLRILAGLEREYSGVCRVDVSNDKRTYLHQHPYLFRGTVLANARYGQRSREKQNGEAIAWLERLGVEHLADRSVENLSGGEIRRVALARSLARKPRLLLLDEPLAELDPESNTRVCEVLSNLPETTLVVASPTELPASLITSTYYLDNK